MKRLLALLLLPVVACSDSTKPESPITGHWSLSLSVTGSGVTCSFTNAPMSLQESGGSFSGTYGPVSMSCGTSQATVGGNVVNGVLNGSSVTWDLDDASSHQTGAINGSSMSGTAVWDVGSGGTTVLFNGTWSATKK